MEKIIEAVPHPEEERIQSANAELAKLPPKKRPLYWAWLIARYAIGASIITWLIRSNQASLDGLANIGVWHWLILLALVTVSLIVSSCRVKALLKSHGINTNTRDCTLFNSVGIFYSTFLPGGMSGDAARLFYFHRHVGNHPNGKSALLGALVTDRLIGTAVMIFIGLCATTYSSSILKISYRSLVTMWIFFAVGMALYFVICKRIGHRTITERTHRHGKIIAQIRKILGKLDLSSYPPRVIYLSIFYSLISHLCTTAVIYITSQCALSGLGAEVIIAIAPAGLLFNAIPLSPGGLGIGEKGFDTLYTLAGGNNGGSAFLLARIFLFMPALLGAVVATTMLGRRSRPSTPPISEG